MPFVGFVGAGSVVEPSSGTVTDPSELIRLKDNKFKDPGPALVTTPLVAPVLIEESTCAGLKLGFAASNRAAIPATWGLAIEVPLMVFAAEDDPTQAEVIAEPGANRSKQLP